MYGKVVEEIPKDAPDPIGNKVVTTTFLDANLMHDVLTGRPVTAMLHFSTQHMEIGTPKDKQLWIMQPMDLSLWCLRQQQDK